MPDRSHPTQSTRDELTEFLNLFAFIYADVSDTFAYTTADAERIYLDREGNTEALVRAWRQFGHPGVVAYVSLMRGVEPIKPYRTEDYELAKQALRGWEYEPD